MMLYSPSRGMPNQMPGRMPMPGQAPTVTGNIPYATNPTGMLMPTSLSPPSFGQFNPTTNMPPDYYVRRPRGRQPEKPTPGRGMPRVPNPNATPSVTDRFKGSNETLLALMQLLGIGGGGAPQYRRSPMTE